MKKPRDPDKNPFRQKKETLSEFNARRAKERAAGMQLRRLGNLTPTRGGPPDWEKIIANAPIMPPPDCPNCNDIGWILRDTPKGTYSRRCPCKANTYADIKPPEDDDIPI